MSNDLAVINSLPEHIRALVKPEDAAGQRGHYREQFGHLEPRDLGLNFIKLAYDNSKTTTGTWATPEGRRPPSGSMFLSRDGKVIPPGTPFVPLLRNTRYILWEGKPGQGRMVFSTQNPKDPQILAIRGLEWSKDPNTGNPIAPKVTTYVSFFVMVMGHDQPVVLSFKRTGMNEGRLMTQVLMEATNFGTIPMYSLQFILKEPRSDTDGQHNWWLYNIAPAGYTDARVLPKAQQMSMLAEALAQATSDAEFADEGDAEAPSTPPSASSNLTPAPTLPTPPGGAPVVTPPAATQPVSSALAPAPAPAPAPATPALVTPPPTAPVAASPAPAAPAPQSAPQPTTEKPTGLWGF